MVSMVKTNVSFDISLIYHVDTARFNDIQDDTHSSSHAIAGP